MAIGLRKRLFEILEFSSKEDRATRVDDIFLSALILLNAFAVVLETVESIYQQHKLLFDMFELVSILIFTVEYLLRLWVCTFHEEFSRPFWGRLRFALTPLAIVDLLAIVPFYFPFIIPLDLRFLRSLRLFRFIRVLKLGRYSLALQNLGRVVKAKREELLMSLAAVLALLFFSSCLMYYVESEAQPEAFSSIPKALWWGAMTLTTVGYGDIYPVTVVGRIAGAFIALLGIGVFALPAGILASGFSESIHRGKSARVCPHCSKEID